MLKPKGSAHSQRLNLIKVHIAFRGALGSSGSHEVPVMFMFLWVYNGPVCV